MRAALIQLSFMVMALLSAAFPATHAAAQDATEAAEINTELRNELRARWQRTDVIILSPEDALDAKRPSQGSNNRSWRVENEDFSWVQTFATIVLIALVALGLYLWLQNKMGGGLFAKPAEDRKFDVEGMEVGGMDVSASNEFSVDDIMRHGDPRQALRLLMVNVLARAARTNDVPVRRSLTARDIVARLPETWAGRERVADLVSQAEPILFGGRDLSAERLSDLVEQARPVLALNRGTP
ncbi:DUF4129 domain-containing protein [Pseudahrensia aquimaris]|uniref:DUF4129 domain-containing protein n=1 Tax=Pseudahrensia aquimaris TaxID=744461 RepID=A0ABW3FE95_9HYPH